MSYFRKLYLSFDQGGLDSICVGRLSNFFLSTGKDKFQMLENNWLNISLFQ